MLSPLITISATIRLTLAFFPTAKFFIFLVIGRHTALGRLVDLRNGRASPSPEIHHAGSAGPIAECGEPCFLPGKFQVWPRTAQSPALGLDLTQ